MMDNLKQDLEKEINEGKLEEENAQKDYEALMVESQNKRSADSKAVTEKSEVLAATTADMNQHTEDKQAREAELTATMTMTADLHAECDFLLQNFDVRKKARSAEIEGLAKAKSVLKGA